MMRYYDVMNLCAYYMVYTLLLYANAIHSVVKSSFSH